MSNSFTERKCTYSTAEQLSARIAPILSTIDRWPAISITTVYKNSYSLAFRSYKIKWLDMHGNDAGSTDCI